MAIGCCATIGARCRGGGSLRQRNFRRSLASAAYPSICESARYCHLGHRGRGPRASGLCRDRDHRLFFGLLTVWLTVVAVRSLGAIANAQLHAQATQESARKQQIAPRRIYADRRLSAGAEPRSQPLVASLAKLKNSIELGTIGNAVKTADVVPPGTYETLGKLGQVLSNRQSAERFLYYPGAKELTENPKIVALRNDPEIIQMIEEQRFLDLLQDKRLIDAVNDPTLAAQVRSFDFERALDYAAKR